MYFAYMAGMRFAVLGRPFIRRVMEGGDLHCKVTGAHGGGRRCQAEGHLHNITPSVGYDWMGQRVYRVCDSTRDKSLL